MGKGAGLGGREVEGGREVGAIVRRRRSWDTAKTSVEHRRKNRERGAERRCPKAHPFWRRSSACRREKPK